MNNLFIITASNPDAQLHIRDTIDSPVPVEKAEKHFTGEELKQIRRIDTNHKYYAWGAVPGERNIPTWEKMQVGDHILIYQNKAYTYYTRILFKARNKAFALDNWGKDGDGNTWEYMYLLEKPIKFASPVSASLLAEYLPASYMGFTQITNDRIAKIVSNYNSLEKYLSNSFPSINILSVNSLPNFWWVNQGRSYSEDRGMKYIWAPKASVPREGVERQAPYHWVNMTKVNKGDVVFNYAHVYLQAVSIATSKGYDYVNPNTRNWDKNGIRIDLQHYIIDPMPLENIRKRMEDLNSALSNTKGPFDVTGSIKQGYLFEFNYEAAKIIRDIYGKPFPEPIEKYFSSSLPSEQPNTTIDEIMVLQTKKQIILYGPPGTGKTFNSQRMAMLLLRK